MKIKVSIIFPVHNGKADTLKCLKSISLLTYPRSQIEAIMVDNKSTDKSAEVVKKYFPKVKIISLSENFGFARAVNEGLKRAKGDYLFIINNDMIFEKKFLTTLVDFMEGDPRIGITGGKIFYARPKHKILFCGLRFNPWTGSISKLPNPDQMKESEWIQGCAMLVRRRVIKKIGFFDENFFFSFEDLDFCQRAQKAGFRVIYHPQAVAWHKEGATIDKYGLRKKAFELYKAKFRYIFKNSSLPQIITSTLFQIFLIAPLRRFIIKSPPFFLRPMLAGYLYNLKRLPKIVKERA